MAAQNIREKKKSKFCPLLFHNAIEFYSTFKYLKKKLPFIQLKLLKRCLNLLFSGEGTRTPQVFSLSEERLRNRLGRRHVSERVGPC